MKKKRKIAFNSPVILIFGAICFVATALGYITNDFTTNYFFSVYRSSLQDPLTYVRLFGHVFGHADFEHLVSNMTFLLLIGPLLEEKYGSQKLTIIIAITAFVTALVQVLFFTTGLLGASGVVFAFIILSSITSIKGEGIPLTFIFIAILYLGQEVYSAIFIADNVSQMTHIVGGIVGAVLGFSFKDKNSSPSIKPTLEPNEII